MEIRAARMEQNRFSGESRDEAQRAIRVVADDGCCGKEKDKSPRTTTTDKNEYKKGTGRNVEG